MKDRHQTCYMLMPYRAPVGDNPFGVKQCNCRSASLEAAEIIYLSVSPEYWELG